MFSHEKWVLLAVVMTYAATTAAATSPMDAKVSPQQIVRQCNYKEPGQDQRSRLTIVLKNQDGRKRRHEYRRLWQNNHGKKGLADKMVLFTQSPPDAKDVAFMRWAYTPEAKKNAQQWIYLPKLRKVRRISVRDLNDSFLGSDLTYGDISLRNVDQDRHRLLNIVRVASGEYFLIESRPKESSSLYSKKIQWFLRAPQWDGCNRQRTDYYDRKGDLLKRQYIHWKRIKNAWVWDKMMVENMQTFHSSMFVMDQVEIDVGLKAEQFTERALRGQ